MTYVWVCFLAPTTKDFKKLYGTNTVFLNKYPADGLSDLRYNNVPLVRLSEVYLNAAEAAAKLGNQNDKAVEYLDAIVKRANPNKTVKGTTVTVDRVLLERRKELIGEGHRFLMQCVIMKPLFVIHRKKTKAGNKH